jgi:hypothetical protein
LRGKTKARLKIDIVGGLAALIDRIKSRGVVGMTLLSDPKRPAAQALRLFQKPG